MEKERCVSHHFSLSLSDFRMGLSQLYRGGYRLAFLKVSNLFIEPCKFSGISNIAYISPHEPNNFGLFYLTLPTTYLAV